MKIHKKDPKPVGCPNNDGVACMYPDRCKNCGWNPDVAKARSVRYQKQVVAEVR